MDKAQRSISVLTKDQLLAESRNAQQVHGLINLHMTTNPPANIIPLLTWLQIKVNVLKAQVESLINKKVMECQGYGYEVRSRRVKGFWSSVRDKIELSLSNLGERISL